MRIRPTCGPSAPTRRASRTAVAAGASLLVVVFGVGMVAAVEIRTDSRSPYVHRVNLYDEDGNAIIAGQDTPFSPRKTCGKCHDYVHIRAGWHFNAYDANAPAGRTGQPWVLADPATGTQLPMSYRPWPGLVNPAAAGMTPWRFVKAFGRHMPGGGPGELSKAEMARSPEKVRWMVSGSLEIDCMSCHSADPAHDQAERSNQVSAENFRWAPSAVTGLAIVRGAAGRIRVPDDFDTLPEEMQKDAIGKDLPKTFYNQWRFDKDDRVLFNITRRAPPERCYFCHTTRQAGPPAPDRWRTDTDVHAAAGLGCTDCHRNGLDHAITRGYEGEKVGGDKGAVASLSCRGCHLGQDSALVSPETLGGRMGAPVPGHVGLPAVHLEKLTCTVCHSGPWPLPRSQRVQTSRAHGLGTVTSERSEDDLPLLAEPAFVLQADGKIGLHRAIWPAFWGRLKGQNVTPVLPEAVPQGVKALLQGKEAPEERVAKALAAMAGLKDEAGQTIPGEPVYVTGGKLYRRGADGKLTASDHPAARPYTWPFAHDVRPAEHSLGADNRCTDCHSAQSAVLFAQVSPDMPLKLATPQAVSMSDLAGLDYGYHKLLAATFTVRPLLKVVCSLAAAVVAVVLILYGFRGLGAIVKAVAGRPRKT